MKSRYRLSISNGSFKKEIQLPIDKDTVKIGTQYGADIRFYKEDFRADFEIVLNIEGESWYITCLNNTFLSLGDARKVLRLELAHGIEADLCSQISGAELCHMVFSYDFDWEEKKYDGIISLENIKRLMIGTRQDCDIYLLDNLEDGELIEIQNQGNYLEAIVHSTRIGFCVNGKPIVLKGRVMDTDFFSIAHFYFYYRHGQLYVANSEHLMVRNLNYKKIVPISNGLNYPEFIRNPHYKLVLPEDEIQILDPAEKPHKEDGNLLMSLLPSLAMLVLVIVVRGFMSESGGGVGYILFSVCSMAIGIVTSIINYFKGKKKYENDLREREATYRAYIENKTTEIKQARDEESMLLNKVYPSEKDTLRLVNGFSGDLFDRTKFNEEFLKIRLGQGAVPSVRKITYKPKETILPSDELECIPKEIASTFEKVVNVPVICDLQEIHNLGVVGTDKYCYEFLKMLVLDICAHHYHEEVQVFFAFNEERKKQMGWSRMLPHVQNSGRGLRNIICDKDSQVTQYEYLYKELSYRKSVGEKLNAPWIVVLMVDDCEFGNHPVSKFLEDAHKYRVHFVFFEKYYERLPMHCGATISLDNEQTGLYYASGAENKVRFSFQNVSDEQMYMVSQKLAPIRCEDINLEGTLTKNISLFELLDIYSADDLELGARWKQKDIGKTMEAPLGVKSKGEVVYLDLHETAHGPHGLVAGTTGSGKSELLQTYILSMAVQYSPYEVGFVLIDFKGGGMANQFRNLPHLIGAITDIDGKEINRSLLSIRAELDRRKELFAKAEVNSIKQYIKKYKNSEVSIALPHLIIIVDEFAELKAEQPEFMKELISASRIGRSLGVHLILATQKPAGQVSDQIWSNSRFKMCLKVQSQTDSNEVIKSPLAAEIKEPGRAYLQVGNNEIFELLQSAYSGASEKRGESKVNKKRFHISSMDLAGRREIIYEQKPEIVEEQSRSQLQAIVDKVEQYCKENNIEKLPNICLPPLPELLQFPDYIQKDNGALELKVEVGVYDAPEYQYQGPAVLNLTGKNTVIIGSSQYGKTNLLQDIIRMLATKYTPEDVNIYILDFGSMFLKNYEELPHVGGVVCASEDEKFRNLFKLLNFEIASRKDKLVSAGVSSFSSYREAGYKDLPYIVLMVDNFTAVKELYFSDEDELLYLCREGASVGISVIITNAQTAGFGYRYFSTISNQIALYCNEADEINSLFGYCKERPDNRPGSCLIQIDKSVYHAQTWLAFEGKREIDRSKAVRSFITDQIQVYGKRKAKLIPQVPETLTLDDAYNFVPGTDVKEAFAIGVDYEEIEKVTLDFQNQFMLALLGEKKEHKQRFVSNLLVDIRTHIFERDVCLYIVDSISKNLKSYEDLPFVEKYTSQAESLIEIVEDLEAELQRRMDIVDLKGEDVLKKLPLLMVIINNQKAIELMGASKQAMKQFDNISKNYRNLKVLFLFADVENTGNVFSAGELMKRIRDEKKVLLFDSLKNSKLIEFPLQIVRQKNHTLRQDDAFFVNKEVLKRIKTVEDLS